MSINSGSLLVTERSEFSQHIICMTQRLTCRDIHDTRALTSKRETSVVGPKLASESTDGHGHPEGIGSRKPYNSEIEDLALGRTCAQKEQLSQAHRRNINIPPNQRCCNLPPSAEATSQQQNCDVLSQRISCVDERGSGCLRASGNQHHLGGAAPKGTKRQRENRATRFSSPSVNLGGPTPGRTGTASRRRPGDCGAPSWIQNPQPPNGIILH